MLLVVAALLLPCCWYSIMVSAPPPTLGRSPTADVGAHYKGGHPIWAAYRVALNSCRVGAPYKRRHPIRAAYTMAPYRVSSRHRAGPKCCNLRCGRTRRRQLARTAAAVLRAGNLMVCAGTPPESKEKHCFLQASKEDRRGLVGDVRLARAAECIECIAAADCRSDTPLAARRIGSKPLVRLALSSAAIASYIEEPA